VKHKAEVQTLADEAGSAPLAEASVSADAPAGRGPYGTIMLANPPQVKRPAQALLATGIFNWVGSVVIVALLAFTELGQHAPISETEMAIAVTLMVVFSSIIILGGIKMSKLDLGRGTDRSEPAGPAAHARRVLKRDCKRESAADITVCVSPHNQSLLAPRVCR
jgi:hypothetical protein